jgi:RNA polymerase sigma factor for flagellar operon FliA
MKTADLVNSGKDATPGAAAWRAYQGVTQSAIDEKDLIERYLPLVRNVVDRVKITLPPHIDADDLYSVGVTGLIAAVRKYNPEQGNTFAGYAATRIRGAVLDELRRLDWCPRRARARARKLKESINDLEQRIGRTATEDEICEDIGVSQAEYRKWLDESRPLTFVALDSHAAGEESDGGRRRRHYRSSQAYLQYLQEDTAERCRFRDSARRARRAHSGGQRQGLLCSARHGA